MNRTSLKNRLAHHVKTRRRTSRQRAFGGLLPLRFEQLETRDLLAPIVTSPQPLEIETLPAGTSSVEIHFSEPVSGAGEAANYQLRSLGPDGSLGTDDDTIHVLSAEYSDTSHATATVSFTGLSDGVYRLTVRDTITNEANEGLAGGDWRWEFAVVPPEADVVPVFPTGPYMRSYGIAAGDFNSDEINDLVITGESGTVTLFVGDGARGFEVSQTYDSGGWGARFVAVGNFNGDTYPDVAVANFDSGNVGVLLGNGTGGFASAITYESGGSANAIAVGDFDSDGDQDLAVANSTSGSIGILLSYVNHSGDWGLAAAVTYGSGGDNPSSLAVGDFNNDGNQDLTVANGDNIGILLGNGSGEFPTAVTYGSGGREPASVTVGDFNRNGNLDIAVANAMSDNVAVLLGNGSGGFAKAVKYGSGGTAPRSITMADFNRDGKQDLAVANYASGNVGILIGNGDGKFAAALTYGSGGTYPISLAAGDFNGDDFQDLAVTNLTSNGPVGVLLNKGESGAGEFQLAVPYAPLDTFPRCVVVGDFNGDEDAFDDLAVLSWPGATIGLLLNTEGSGFASTVEREALHEFDSANGFTFGIQATGPGAGQLVAGADGAFDGLNRLRVGVADYSAGTQGSYLTNEVRTLVTPTVTLAGLYVHREITVPDTGSYDYAQTVDVFENVTDSSITTTVRMVGNLGSNQNTTLWQTTDQWTGTDDGDENGGMLAIVHAFDLGGTEPTPVQLPGDQGDNIEWTYEIAVPARATVQLTHLTIVATTRTLAAEAVASLLQNSNQPPVATDDSYSIAQGNTLSVAAPGVLANDSDPNNDPVTAVLEVAPEHGTLSLNSDGSFSYTPDAVFTGTDSFTYKANDGTVDSNIATVTIEVTSQPVVSTLHVSDLDGSARWVNKTKWAATVIATVYDETGRTRAQRHRRGNVEQWHHEYGNHQRCRTSHAPERQFGQEYEQRHVCRDQHRACVVAIRARGQHGPRR